MKQRDNPEATEGNGMSRKYYAAGYAAGANNDRNALLNRILDQVVSKIADTSIPRKQIDEYQLKLIAESNIDQNSDFAVEYLSGVFAASSEMGNISSTAEIFIKDVLSLSEIDLKLHTLIYDYVVVLNQQKHSTYDSIDPVMSRFSISFATVFSRLGLDEISASMAENSILEAAERLKTRQLIEDYVAGDVEELIRMVPSSEVAGLAVQPSTKGLQLLSWSRGNGNNGLDWLAVDRSKTREGNALLLKEGVSTMYDC